MKERMCDNGLLAYIPIHIHTHICTHTYICLCINKNIRIHSEHGDTITEESCHDHDISKYSVLFMYFFDLIFLSCQIFLLAFNRYMNDLFRNNGTAVLLDRVPNDISLKFPGTRFQNNGTDIDNRCGHALELDEAVFE